MIKNMLIRRKSSDTYLDTFRRHRWSAEMRIIKDNCGFYQLKRNLFSSSSVHSSDVYEKYPGRCCSISFFVTVMLYKL